MRLYADHPTRRTRQAVGDLVAVLLLLLAVLLAREVRATILELRGPGEGLRTAGTGLRDTFTSAASKASGVPLVGDDLAGALNGGAGAGDKLIAAGQWQVDAVESLALWVFIALIAVPAAFLLIVWLPRRYRFTREATAATRLRDAGDEGRDLLALRALVTTPCPASPARSPWRPAGAAATPTPWTASPPRSWPGSASTRDPAAPPRGRGCRRGGGGKQPNGPFPHHRLVVLCSDHSTTRRSSWPEVGASR
ncbi:hypothetical protein [Actinokineospora bangkokensis]|uniref:hypothetical protein n=1 Tax=Actinokineospora bangkokensis TaxID=1193682 RepID=UPI000A5A84B2|nr:hypothetical protein [Actinokineospora bangkokensis]